MTMTTQQASTLLNVLIFVIASCAASIAHADDALPPSKTAEQLGVPMRGGCTDFQVNQMDALLPKTLFSIAGGGCGGKLRLVARVYEQDAHDHVVPWVSGKLSVFDVTNGYEARVDLCKKPEDGLQNPKSSQLYLQCSVVLVVATGEVRYLLIDWVTKDLAKDVQVRNSFLAQWRQSRK